jgi:hypothetical protein
VFAVENITPSVYTLIYYASFRPHIAYMQTFPPAAAGNTTVTDKMERYNTSSVVCWIAASFLLLSFCFAWLRSPRSGRVVFAMGLLAVIVTQGIVYVFWEKYNLDLYVLICS